MKISRFLVIFIYCGIVSTLIGCSIQNAQNLNVGQNEKLSVQVSADYPYYSSIDALTKKADLIIAGTVLDSRVEEIDTRIKNPDGDDIPSSKDVYTVYTIKVSDSYKGNVKPGEIIEFKQIGGEGKNKVYVVEDNVKFDKNKKYVLFLSTYENTYPSLLNPIQSAYYAITDSTVEKELVSINAKNDLTFTIEDLMFLNDDN